MKKRLQVEPEISALIIKVQEQLASLEKKIDTLIGRPLPRPPEQKPFYKPFQHPSQGNNRADSRQGNNFRERAMHKTICADCKKECEVPFKPTGDRPVYCKECFSKRKAGGPVPLKVNIDNKPREAAPVQVIHNDKPQGSEKKKPAGKKKTVSKKQKKR